MLLNSKPPIFSNPLYQKLFESSLKNHYITPPKFIDHFVCSEVLKFFWIYFSAALGKWAYNLSGFNQYGKTVRLLFYWDLQSWMSYKSETATLRCRIKIRTVNLRMVHKSEVIISVVGYQFIVYLGSHIYPSVFIYYMISISFDRTFEFWILIIFMTFCLHCKLSM